MTPPRVHILLPTYEPNETYLRDAISSAQAQTYTDWTMLVHDDASHKDVHAMIEPFLHDERIAFLRSETRRGIGGNWNACFAHASTPYVQFLFQDDRWEPAYLERCVDTLDAHPSVALVAAHHAYLAEDGTLPDSYKEVTDARTRLPSGVHSGEAFLMEWIARGLHPNLVGEPPFVMLRREAMRQAGTFHPSMKQALDSEYWIRLLMRGDIAIVQESLGTFRVHDAAASAMNERSGEGMFDRLLCFDTAIRVLPKEKKKQARAARDLHFRMMARKFLRRGKNDTGVPENTSAKRKILPLLRFALRHPLLLLSCAVRQPFLRTSP